MPLFVQIILVVVPCVAIALAARALLRRRLSAEELEHAERAVPFLLTTVGGFFGLLAGFMLSNSWAELSKLRNTMTAEVNSLADMARIANHLPQPQAGQLRLAIDRYLQTVVEDELPAMSEGRMSPATTQAIGGLWAPLATYKPQTSWEASLRSIATEKAMELGENRRQRLSFIRDQFPTLLWWILLSTGLIVVAGATVASLRYKRTAGAFLAALVAIVTVVLFSIHVIERPFQYRLTIVGPGYITHWEVLGGSKAVRP